MALDLEETERKLLVTALREYLDDGAMTEAYGRTSPLLRAHPTTKAAIVAIVDRLDPPKEPTTP